MLFNSFPFIFVFLPLALLGYYLIKSERIQLWFLFFSSVIFYAYWSKTYVLLLLFTVVLDFYIAKAIFHAGTQRRRKALLLSSVIANLAILGFFKYYNFFAGSVNEGMQALGVAEQLLPVFQLILPIGISFYTFQSMSYVIDVYRRTCDAHAGLLPFAGYVTFFPHQIAGPLVRHNQIVPQLEAHDTYHFQSDNFWRGWYFFVFGLSKKILIADRIAPVVDSLVHSMGTISNVEATLALVGYTMQLYFDFSGYSDMAVGLGLMMNIRFPQNFNSPYKSRSITEFWQRWHITLSSWLRDYLYISLGGNRKGSIFTYRNLLLTMIIGGLWHGASWVFVIWGAYHGFFLAAERFAKDAKWSILKNSSMSSTGKWIITFIIVCVGWTFFRSPDVATALLWLKKVFFLTDSVTWDLVQIAPKNKDRFFVALSVALLIAAFAKNTFEINFRPTLWRAILLALMFVICLSFMNEESPFLYFQF